MFDTSPLRVARSRNGQKQFIHSKNDSYKETASFQGNSGLIPTGMSDERRASNRSLIIGGVDVTTPYIDPIPHQIKCNMYQDIYVHDAVAGAAIDLMCNLPFSEFTLRFPVEDPEEKYREIFEENLNRLNINTMLPNSSREHMVFGAYISMLIYKHEERIFTDTIPFQYKYSEVVSNILYSRDPVIRVNVSPEQKEFIKSTSEVSKQFKQRISPNILNLLESGSFELDPLSSIYFPRKTFSWTDVGISMYQRILPLYILEKVLLRGTITLANRRQNSVMHVQAGSDEWEPTTKDLNDLVSLVIEADRDPIGSTIATRQDVNINEIKSGGDFWKWNDISEELNSKKLLALGINQSFLEGEISYNSMEHALIVFLEHLKAFRNQCTNQFFYNKLFPLIAVTNNLTLSKAINTETAAKIRRYSNMIDYQIADRGSLIIPIVEWEKKLSPEGNSEVLDMMERLAERGVPFSLRTWAAAGGYSLDQLIREEENSISVEKQLKEIKEKKKKELGIEGEEEEKQERWSAEMATADPMIDITQPRLKEMGILRNYSERDSELGAKTVTGKRKYVYNQHKRQKEANEVVADALHKMSGKKLYQSRKV